MRKLSRFYVEEVDNGFVISLLSHILLSHITRTDLVSGINPALTQVVHSYEDIGQACADLDEIERG